MHLTWKPHVWAIPPKGLDFEEHGAQLSSGLAQRHAQHAQHTAGWGQENPGTKVQCDVFQLARKPKIFQTYPNRIEEEKLPEKG